MKPFRGVDEKEMDGMMDDLVSDLKK